MANEPMKRCSTPEVLRETSVTVRRTSEDGGDTRGWRGCGGRPPPRPGGMGRGTAHRRQLAVCALGWPRETEARGHVDTCPERARRRRRPSPPRELPGTDRRLSRPPAGRLRGDDAERKDPEERRTSAQNARRRKLIYSDKKTRAAGSGGEAEGQRQGWVRGVRRATSPSFCAPGTHQGVGRRWHLAEAV